MKPLWALLVAGSLAGVSADTSAAQGRLLPEMRYFRTPVADPYATRISVGLKRTDLLASQAPEQPPFPPSIPGHGDNETVAAIALGVVFPLAELARGERGGALLYADARVFGRFRIERSSRDDMGQDWFVGGGMEAALDRWSARLAIVHRSSHLGDEFAAQTGARRIEFGSEQLDLLVAWDARLARVYGGGSWLFRSYLDWDPQLRELGVRDRALVQVGADRVWHVRPDSRLAVYAGVDVQAAERTEWGVGVAAAAGIGVQTRRSFRIMARFYDGPSTMGEFFLTPERFYTLEMVAEL